MKQPRAPHNAPPLENQDRSVESDNQMDALRRILLEPEQEKISQLQARLDNQPSLAEEISQILPAAIELSNNRDTALSQSLMSTVEAAVKSSIHKDISVFAESLYPIMGPAIRKSISEAFKDLIQSLNIAVENSLSWQGLQWRFESIRTGRSFSEVALLRSLVFRVEQVFLIHRETGFLLQHLEGGIKNVQDVDMVSGMLTAISDFVQDSFSVTEQSVLDSIQFGDLTVMIEAGPLAVIAVAIRGNAPPHIRDNLRQALELIHLEKNHALSHFKGDMQDFEESKRYLEPCLQAQYKTNKQKKHKPPYILILILLCFLIPIAYWAFSSHQDKKQWQAYITRLHQEPGIVITDVNKNSGRYAIKGLRDPLAKFPQLLRTESTPIPESDIDYDLKPYQAMSPKFILQRAEKTLNKPKKISFSLDKGILRAQGIASKQWQLESKLLSRVIPGIHFYDDTAVSNINLADLNAPPEVTLAFDKGKLIATGRASNQWIMETRNKVKADLGMDNYNDNDLINIELTQLKTLTEQLERKTLLFDGYSPKQVLQQLYDKNILSSITSLAKQAQELKKHLIINIVGHTDNTGTDYYNQILSEKRADLVFQYLVNKEISGIVLHKQGVASRMPLGNDPSNKDKLLNRSVTFKVSVSHETL